MTKKLIISLSIIGAVAAIATGVTIALFSDTETSAGNIFVAGTMDLKVDHKYSMYNGDECTRGDCIPTGLNLILNDGFEGPPSVTHSTGWDIFPNGAVGLGWSVEWVNLTSPYQGVPRPAVANIEFHKSGNLPNTSDIPNGWVAHSGQQYIELDSDWNGHVGTLNNEPALARIYQDIATVPGTKYELRYWHSYRPGVSNNTMNVKADGNLLRTVTANGTGQTNTNWVQYIDVFTATDNSTRIEFEGAGPDDSLGIFLDDVNLYEMRCEYVIIGGQCNLWEEKDLGEGDFFWNFDDVKPGDYGTNIISLHVFGNNAYSCLLVNNTQDLDNDVINPEINAGDDIASTTGELSQFLNAFVWVDSTQNNKYDVGETPLYGPNLPLKDMKNMTKLPLTATTTAYVGVAWCFGAQSVDPITGAISCSGTGNQNIAQTDSFLAWLTAFATQQRNNADFDCKNVVLPQ